MPKYKVKTDQGNFTLHLDKHPANDAELLSLAEEALTKRSRQAPAGQPPGEFVGPQGPTVPTKSNASLSDLPFSFRRQLFSLRENAPGQLKEFLKAEGFDLVPTQLSGKQFFKDKDGKVFDIEEPLRGQFLLQEVLPEAVKAAGFFAPGGMVARGIGITASTLAGKRIEEALTAAPGVQAVVSLADDLFEVGKALAFEGGMQVVGATSRLLSGKQGVVSTGKQTEKLARPRLELAQDVATDRVATRQAALDQLKAKAEERALAPERERLVLGEIERGLGMTREQALALPAQSIEELASTKFVARSATQKTIRGTFDRIGKRFDDLLNPFREIPVKGRFEDITDAVQEWVAGEGAELSPRVSGLLRELSALGGEKSEIIRELSKQGLSPEALTAVKTQIGAETGEATVNQLLGLRTRFSKVVGTSANPNDRAAAAQAIEGLDGFIGQVLPVEAQATHQVLRQQWGEARILFSDGSFMSRLNRAGSPARVVDAIVANPNKVERAVQIFKEARPTEKPVIRAAFAARILEEQNPEKLIRKLNPSLFRELFPGSGAAKPAEWLDALRNRANFQTIANDPVALSRFQAAYNDGLSSLGAKTKEAALARAQRLLEGANVEERLAKAVEQAEVASLKRPFTFTRYLENRIGFQTSLALSGGASLATGNPSFVGLTVAYLGSSVGFRAAMENPTIAGLYLRMLKSPTAEAAGFYAGRMAAVSLSISGREMIGRAEKRVKEAGAAAKAAMRSALIGQPAPAPPRVAPAALVP